MSDRPNVFISATTRDLRSYRDTVRDAILTLKACPVVQDDWPPDYRSVSKILQKEIAECDAVICLIGPVFGQEPKKRDKDDPRRSYTQLEHDIAVALDKPVFAFFAAEDCPLDHPPDEPEELRELQREHIAHLKTLDRRRESFRSREELKQRVSALRFDAVSLRGLATNLTVVLDAQLVDVDDRQKERGVEAWVRDVAVPYHQLLKTVLERWDGAVQSQEESGEECLVNFKSARDAARAALDLHETVRTHDWRGAAPGVRVGVNMGEIFSFGGAGEASVLQAGRTVDLCRTLTRLALSGQTLFTRGAADDARQSVIETLTEDAAPVAEPLWLAHGRYVLAGDNRESLEVFELGIPGRAPLQPPPDRPGVALSADSLEEAQMRGWRPSIGQPIPGRDDWTIAEKLGEGGFGEVWLARKPLKEPHVFKFCFDPERLRSFKRELTIFNLLKQELGDRDDIAKLLDVQVDKPPYFLESEYVASGDLSKWCERQKGLCQVPFATRLKLLIGVARAVAAAHSLGVIHKDLKPSNIFIVERNGVPQPLLADFGIGILTDRSRLDEKNVTGMSKTLILGNNSSRTWTWLYAPPESKLPGKAPTTAVDVYALGVMLYQFVVGDLARPLGTGWEEGISDELLRDDIAAATHHDPARRLASAAQLADRLERLEPRRAERESIRRAARTAARLRRLKTVTGAVAAAVVVVGGLALFSLTQWQRAESEASNAVRQQQLAEANEAKALQQQALAERNAAEASRQQLIAETNEKRALEQTELAHEQAELALTTLDSVIFDIQRKLKDVPAAHDVRRSLLKTALAGLQKVASGLAGQSQVDRNQAAALIDLAEVILRAGSDDDLGASAAALRLLEQAHASLSRLAEASLNDHAAQRDLSISYQRLGDVMLRLGQTDAAHKYYQNDLAISRKLAEDEPSDAQAQRDLSISYNKLGDVTLLLGRTDAALKYFQDGLEIRRKLAEADPPNAQAQRDLSMSYNRLGDVTLQFGQIDTALNYFLDALEIRRKLAEADPRDAQVQRDLSISYNRLGDVTLQLGQTDAALKYFRDSLEISRKLAEADTRDAQAQRDLWVSCNKVGDVTLQLGQTDTALKYCEAALEISRKLADADPRDAQAQRDLSISYEKLGDVMLRSGQTDAALKYFRDSLEISRKLAEADTRDAQAQRDLSISYEKLGDVMLRSGQTDASLKYYQDGLEISRKLAEADPRDAWSQRNLSVSYNKLGDVTLQLGQTEAALKYYHDDLEISRKLAEADPRDARSQRDLSVSYEKLGDVTLQLGQTEAALKYYHDDLEISRKLAEADPRNAQAQRDLSISYNKVGTAERQRFEYSVAIEHFHAGIAVLRAMIDRDQLAKESTAEIESLEHEIVRCQAAQLATAPLEEVLAQQADWISGLLSLRCSELARKGEFAEVAAAAGKLRERATNNADDLYGAACGYSLCVRVIETPPAGGVFLSGPAKARELTAAEQADRRKYIDLALATLKAAVAAGYKNGDQMKQDTDLIPLRGLPEFEALLKSLSAADRETPAASGQ